MRNEINKIVEKNIQKLRNDKSVVSVFLVGSMASENYVEKSLNDYDIRFIVKEMSVTTYEEIMKILEKIKIDIEKNEIGCQISNVIGPVKMKKIKKRNVLIHSIVMTEKELDQLPNIHKYSYSMNYRQIFGKDFIQKYSKLIITPNDIILSTEGIEFCINLIQTRKNSYTKWIINQNIMTLQREYVAASTIDMVELFYYSYNKTIDNIKNMIKTNEFKVELENYLDYMQDELELINKIEKNDLTEIDINNKNIIIIQKILYKLEKKCLKIYKSNKKYYNSLEWGIIDSDSRDMRKNGFEYLKKMQLSTGNNFSMKYQDYQIAKNKINQVINNSDYIVIFEPPNKNYMRYGLTNVKSIDEIDNYIIDNEIKIEKYSISFIEIIKEISNSFAGTVITDGKGNTIIEIIRGTCDSRELTSTGANSNRINSYRYISFDDKISDAPKIIDDIKEMCQYFRGYFEFAYGEIKGAKDIYFTYYSSNDNYINVFEGGKIKCKSITK